MTKPLTGSSHLKHSFECSHLYQFLPLSESFRYDYAVKKFGIKTPKIFEDTNFLKVA